jgi:hypothetical protein
LHAQEDHGYNQLIQNNNPQREQFELLDLKFTKQNLEHTKSLNKKQKQTS